LVQRIASDEAGDLADEQRIALGGLANRRELALPRVGVTGLRRMLAEKITLRRRDVVIDLVLESAGGSAHAAYKLMLLLRSYASRVRVVVPDYAKSAATLMVLGADEIFMSPYAELGPLDAQIYYEQEGIYVSSLDIARSIERLADTAFTMAFLGGAQALQLTRLSRKDTLTRMLTFTSDFMRPLMEKLDPYIVLRSAGDQPRSFGGTGAADGRRGRLGG